MLLWAARVLCEVYFMDTFDDPDWDVRWMESGWRPIRGERRTGGFRLTAGNFFGDAQRQRGLQTIEEAAFYQWTARFPKVFNTTDKDLVFQYTVRFEQGYECSGAYVKLLSSTTNQNKFHGESPYYITFGPDVCKPLRRKVEFIVMRNGTKWNTQRYLDCFSDELTHAYTLIVWRNRSYEIRMDGLTEVWGDLAADFEVGGSEFIPDPEDAPGPDVDERFEIDDPNDRKPEGWDERPVIADPADRQPDTWRESVQGRWTPRQIANPHFQGVWRPRQIPNPNYRPFEPRQIRNPLFFRDPGFGVFQDLGMVALEFFQMTPGVIFDNILVCDNVTFAEEQLKENFLDLRERELEMYQKGRAAAAMEEERKRLADAEDAQKTEVEAYPTDEAGSTTSTTDVPTESDMMYVFPTVEISEEPGASEFEFPKNKDHNTYFLRKRGRQERTSSRQGLVKWKELRQARKQEQEQPEELPAVIRRAGSPL